MRTKTAWWTVCVSSERPDGPGNIIGPFPSRELTEEELEWQNEYDNGCDNNHIIVHGPGPRNNNSVTWVLPFNPLGNESREYYSNHPDEVADEWRDILGLHPRMG